MNVKLVSVTKSLIEEKELTAEELIIYCARVSSPQNQLNTETAPKLLNYCIKNSHWSILEQASMGIEIITSRAVAQQILRHRSFSFQEFSQRYSQVTDFEPIQLRKQAEKNRQSSSEYFDPIIKDYGWVSEDGTKIQDYSASWNVTRIINESKILYDKLIDSGISKETARMILPLCSQTKIFMNGTIRSWVHYLQVRCDEHTQLEHREIALKIKDIFIENFPNISKSLGWIK